jgi:hypothetical protein
MPEAIDTIVVPLVFTTVKELAPMLRINALWPVDTEVAGGMYNFRPAVEAVTSMMLATTLSVLPLIGH